MTIIEQIYEKNPVAGAKFEGALFNNASHFIADYKGGQWQEQGAPALMGLSKLDRVTLRGTENGFTGETDMRSASVAVWILTLNHSIWYWAEKDESIGRFFDKLWREADAAFSEDSTLDRNTIYAFLD